VIKTKKTALNRARPSLFKVAPLTATICWLFAVINVFVFYSLYYAYRPTVALFLVNNFLNFQVWGLAFLSLAFIGAYNLIKNNWNATKKTLLVGLVIKIAWEITLVLRVFQDKATILTAVLWGFFAAIQCATYIFFLPEITSGRDNEQQRQ
jgi:hypothetical protein